MDSSSSPHVRSGEIQRDIFIQTSPSRLKTYGFAIAIILGIVGLTVGIVGLAGYFHVGAFRNIAQIDAMIMMAAGVGSGVILLATGFVGSLKSHVDPTSKSNATTMIAKPVDTQGGLVFGPEAWNIWNVQVLDKDIPNAPKINLSVKDKIFLYIPQRIRVNGEEKDLTLKILNEITKGPFRGVADSVLKEYGDETAPGGWVAIDKKVLPETRNKNFETQKGMVEKKKCRMPRMIEAVVLNLMVFAHTKERLYGQSPWIYVRCSEIVYETNSVIVGGFGDKGSDNGLDINMALLTSESAIYYTVAVSDHPS